MMMSVEVLLMMMMMVSGKGSLDRILVQMHFFVPSFNLGLNEYIS